MAPDRLANESPVHVAVAVINNSDHDILIQQRAAGTHQGGLWEFPGGKLEPGETVEQALLREIREELNIRVVQSRPLIKVQHDYGDRHVLLDVHRVDQWQGNPAARENQPIKWVQPEALNSFAMPAADKPIVSAVQLPPHYVITPAHIDDPEAIVARFETLLQQGERLFLYRVKSLKGMTHDDLVQLLLDRCDQYRARLVVHEQNRVKAAAHGLHLTESGLFAASQGDRSVAIASVSCHSYQSLLKAEALGAGFAMLSPVMATRSHPGEPALGWERFEKIVGQINLPVYALGGMSPAQVNLAWQHGAQGIAGISHFWSDS